jgi:transcriptional repressor NrdR
MRCPFCDHLDSRVLDSRSSDGNEVIRRRRECPACGRRFTTYERPAELQLFVVKKDGRREAFQRDKVVAGMSKACEKRPVSREAIEEAADRVARMARDQLSDEVPTSRIGGWVMAELRGMDSVAYVRFASVYKEFRDIDSFVKEVESLNREVEASAPHGVRESRSRTAKSASGALRLFEPKEQ